MKVKTVLAAIVTGIVVISVGGFAAQSLLQNDSPVTPVSAAGETTAVGTEASNPTSRATEAEKESTAASTSAQAAEEPSQSGKIGSEYAYAYAGFTPALANTSAQWNLLLVNREYILPDDFEVKLDNCIEGDENSLSLDYRVAPHYSEMYKAAKADGVTLTPISGYRSVERQTRNFENKIASFTADGLSRTEATKKAARTILPPGTSEHNAGLAMDICSLYTSFDETAEYRWLSENAADYGFILRYPEDKTDITHISYEPWHWRYVGVDAARAMKKSGQCFEEYLGIAG